MHQPAYPPPSTPHIHTQKSLEMINTTVLEGKEADGGANWLGNRNEEGQKGTRGKRGPTPSVRTVAREWLISMSPHTHSHPRNSTRKKSNLQNKREIWLGDSEICIITKSEIHQLRAVEEWLISMSPHAHSLYFVPILSYCQMYCSDIIMNLSGHEIQFVPDFTFCTMNFCGALKA